MRRPRGPLLEPCAPRARTKSLRRNLAERTVLLLPIRAPRSCCRARLAVCIAEMGGLRARGPGVTDRVRLVRPVACGLRLAACEYFRSDSGRPGLLGNRQFGPSKFARARYARRPNRPRSRHTVPLACVCISYRLAIAVLEIITYVAAPRYASPRAHAPYHTHAQPSRATRQQNIQPANDRSLALHPSMLPDSRGTLTHRYNTHMHVLSGIGQRPQADIKRQRFMPSKGTSLEEMSLQLRS